MNKKKVEKGDGLAFHNAVRNSSLNAPDIYKKIGIESATFYRLFKKEKFDQETKELAAKALGKTIEEIFPDPKNDTVNEPGEQYGGSLSHEEPRISTDEAENTSKKLNDNEKEAINSSFTKNEVEMYNRYMALLEHKERNMEKLINNNEKFANGLLMLISKLGLKEENIDYPKQKQA